jgi:hypothetical protein
LAGHHPKVVLLSLAPTGSSWNDITQTALIVFVLILCLWRAVRARRRDAAGAGRLVRLLLATAVFATTLTILVGIESVKSDPLRHAVPVLGVGAILIAITAAALIFLIELILWRWRPTRTRAWLAVAACLFLPFFFALFALPVWLLQGRLALMSMATVQFLGAIVGALLIWWSYLPVARVPVARRFA